MPLSLETKSQLPGAFGRFQRWPCNGMRTLIALRAIARMSPGTQRAMGQKEPMAGGPRNHDSDGFRQEGLDSF
jgi:hypothetical protein